MSTSEQILATKAWARYLEEWGRTTKAPLVPGPLLHRTVDGILEVSPLGVFFLRSHKWATRTVDSRVGMVRVGEEDSSIVWADEQVWKQARAAGVPASLATLLDEHLGQSPASAAEVQTMVAEWANAQSCTLQRRT